MAGKAKNGKLVGKNAGKKFNPKNSQIQRIALTAGAIRRLAKRGGVRRISDSSYGAVREFVDSYLTQIVQDTVFYSENAKKRTITAMHVVYALKKNGRVLYGYGL